MISNLTINLSFAGECGNDYSSTLNNYGGFYNNNTYPNTEAFAALKEDGSIKAWGSVENGGSGEPTDNGFVSINGTAINTPENCDHSPLVFTTCGDNNIEGSEQCEDGNTEDGDGCSATCKVEVASGYMCVLDANNDGICDTLGANSLGKCADSAAAALVDNGCTDAVPICDIRAEAVCRVCIADTDNESGLICNDDYTCESEVIPDTDAGTNTDAGNVLIQTGAVKTDDVEEKQGCDCSSSDSSQMNVLALAFLPLKFFRRKKRN